MSATYLIDGYNLIHAMGLLPVKAGPGKLEKARLALLGLLKGSFGDDAGAVTVVFDGSGAPAGSDVSQSYHGIRVQYAQRQQQADDLIEDLLRHAGAPKSLSVVSDDHRLQNAARRRQASVLPCGDFLDFLQKKRRATHARPAAPEKKERLSDQETAEWLREFGDLGDDPELRGLF